MGIALPLINSSELEAVKDDAADHILLFVNKYLQLISTDPTGTIQNRFTAEQNILLAFNILDSQVSSGGFIQLIENGYGSYIFNTPLSHYMREWGAVKLADMIDEARIIYYQKKEILEQQKTLEEFAKLYLQHPEFELPEKEFTMIIEQERKLIKQYIELHMPLFAVIND